MPTQFQTIGKRAQHHDYLPHVDALDKVIGATCPERVEARSRPGPQACKHVESQSQ